MEQLSDSNASAENAAAMYHTVVRDTVEALREYHEQLLKLVTDHELSAVEVELSDDDAPNKIAVTLNSELRYFSIEADSEDGFTAETDLRTLEPYAKQLCGITGTRDGDDNKLIIRSAFNGKLESNDGDGPAMLNRFLTAVATDMNERTKRFNAHASLQ